MGARRIGVCDWEGCAGCENYDSDEDTCTCTPDVELDGEEVMCLSYECIEEDHGYE